jgi:AraC-like DNA-binding protein
MERDAYGNQVGSRFGLNYAPVTTVRALQKFRLRVTETVDNDPDLGEASPMRPEDTFLVHVIAPDCLAHDSSIDNKSVSPAEIGALRHLTRDSIAKLHCPSGDLSFYLRRTALDEMVDHIREQRVRVLYFRHGRVYEDPVIRSLTQALLPALAEPDQFSAFFIDHLGRALRAYIAIACGEMQSPPPIARGGLAPWQMRRAKDLLSYRLKGKMRLAQVARECGLSASHFSRAFRQSLGMAPHQWLLKIRVERAKEQLLNSDASLADIAVDCGFADQSHFTRVFTKHVDASPGQWRRRFSSGPAAMTQESEILVLQ